MERLDQQGSSLTSELHKQRGKRLRQAVLNSAPVHALRGLWLFAARLVIPLLCGYAIYMAHITSSYAFWWRCVLTVAGVLAIIPSLALLYGFLRALGETK